MARSRNIKPDFFTDADLLDCGPWARLLFPGLWVHADRRGILADNPKQIRINVFPADPEVDVDAHLDELADHHLIRRYVVDGKRCIWIRSFSKHQSPHPKEPENGLPLPPVVESVTSNLQVSDTPLTGPASSFSPFPFNVSPLSGFPSSAESTAPPEGASALKKENSSSKSRTNVDVTEWRPPSAEWDQLVAWAESNGKDRSWAERGQEAHRRYHAERGGSLSNPLKSLRGWLERGLKRGEDYLSGGNLAGPGYGTGTNEPDEEAGARAEEYRRRREAREAEKVARKEAALAALPEEEQKLARLPRWEREQRLALELAESDPYRPANMPAEQYIRHWGPAEIAKYARKNEKFARVDL